MKMMPTRRSHFLIGASSWRLATLIGALAACNEAPQSKDMLNSGGAGGSSGAGGAAASSGAGASGGQGGSGGIASGGAGGSGVGGVGGSGGSGGTGGMGSGGMGSGGMSSGGMGGDTPDASAGEGGSGGGNTDGCEGGDQVDFTLIGWAAQNGGTTGGRGGATVNVNTGSALIQALADASGPTTIMVSGTITPANSGGASKIDVKDVQDISIIGAGSGAELNGIGIKIVRASNIVIRNLRVHHVATGDKDAISIEGPADHIWVDHCELYADYQSVDKDFYDGLLDAKAEAEYITYSWNYLHDSWKTALVGSSEDDTFDRKLTMHHNYFRNCNSRLPLFRGGNGHVFNNYYEDIIDTGINARIGACLRIEANYFQDARNPWVSAYSDELGSAELLCNVLAGTSPFEYADDVKELPTCTPNVPYDYDGALNHPDEVPAVVMENAGVGKLDDPADF
jgi:pectate lyase